jgi:hypothetical protein
MFGRLIGPTHLHLCDRRGKDSAQYSLIVEYIPITLPAATTAWHCCVVISCGTRNQEKAVSIYKHTHL